MKNGEFYKVMNTFNFNLSFSSLIKLEAGYSDEERKYNTMKQNENMNFGLAGDCNPHRPHRRSMGALN